MMIFGVSRFVMTRLQCITCMKEYENKSLEELRVEDYAADRKGGIIQDSLVCGAKSATSNVCVQSPLGIPTRNTGSRFLNTSQPTASVLFGQTSSTTFGACATTSTGTFDSLVLGAKSATSNFCVQSPLGIPTPNTGSRFLNTSQPTASGLFGQTSSTTFGAPATTSTGTFGSLVLGAKSATSNVCVQSPLGILTPNTGSRFLNTSQPTGSGLFGETSSTTFVAPATTSTCSFGSLVLGAKSATSNVCVQSRLGIPTPNTGSRFLNTSQPTGSGLFGQTSSTTFVAPATISTCSFGNKFVSCAIQTDISAIDTKDQDLPFLQTKDVTVLTENMKELLIKGSDHDVKITVKDKQFQAHRNILRTRSPVFAMMLTHDSKESITNTIKIEDCDPDSFDEFLLYLYSGRVENLAPTKALHLYYTADKYDIPVLKERCAILLKTSLSVDSICDIILLATRHDEKELLKEATKFFAQNMRKILVTVHWQKFLSENPIEGNALYIKSMEFFVLRK